jgi:hypothetical protein
MILPSDFDRANKELLESPQFRGALKPQAAAKQAQSAEQRLSASQRVLQQTAQAASKPKTEPEAKRAPVTIVCYGGRWLDVYSEDRLDIELINVPALPGSEAALERFCESVLPKRHAKQLWPGWIRFRSEIESLSASEIARRFQRAELIGSLRSAGPLYTGAELLRIATGGRAR